MLEASDEGCYLRNTIAFTATLAMVWLCIHHERDIQFSEDSTRDSKQPHTSSAILHLNLYENNVNGIERLLLNGTSRIIIVELHAVSKYRQIVTADVFWKFVLRKEWIHWWIVAFYSAL